MKRKIGLALLALLTLLILSVSVYAQDSGSAAETVEKLRAQLLEVQTKEDALRTRLAQLDESIKPENIERSLAGIGSTKPEQLREYRRRQLEIERNGVLAQLKTLETSRQRLESAIANAEALAYQQSAQPAPDNKEPINMVASGVSSFQLLMFGGGGLAALALGGGALVYRRKTRLR
jgi:peptidoglycan hydrolase CwlO-like protein